MRVEEVEEHKLHRESYSISAEAAEKINRALDEGRRIIAVGTTTVRTLEYRGKGLWASPGRSGEADLFIYPGFDFRVVSAMLTNFHLPQSTLLMLVCAFGGKENVLARTGMRSRKVIGSTRTAIACWWSDSDVTRANER